MTRQISVIILFACLIGWCTAQVTQVMVKAELPELPEFKPVSELPADIRICSQSDININECIKRSFQEMIPRLKDGIKELNIPPMDPFIIERNNIEVRTGFAQGRVQVRNVRVFGISEGTVQKVDFHLKDNKVSMELVTHMPRFYVEGNYKADMLINDVKMTPKGYFNVTMTDLQLSSEAEGELYQRDGHTYLKLTKFNFDPEIGDMNIYASNLVADPALTADIRICSQSDININECIKRSFQEMIPRLKDGIKELNIPPMDPFVIERNNIEVRTGFAQGRVQVRNVRVFGISEGTVQKVDFHLKDNKVSMELVTHMPRFYVEGNYKADMLINDVKMTPKGYFNVTMTDLQLSSEAEGELYQRDGHTYLKLTKFNFDPEIGDMNIYASNLVADPALNAVILDFINQYWPQVYKIMIPQTRSTWEPMFLEVMNSFLGAIPFDLYFKRN